MRQDDGYLSATWGSMTFILSVTWGMCTVISKLHEAGLRLSVSYMRQVGCYLSITWDRILVLLWQLFYLFCSSIVIKTVIVTAGTFEPLWSGRFGALKSYSADYFFRYARTKSRSLRFSQFSGCWLILSVYKLMSFECSFGRLFGVR